MDYFKDSYNNFEKMLELLKNNNDINALVIGDIILDKYTYGKIERVSTGVAIPTINVEKTEFCLGGAGNVAANLKKFTNKVSIIGQISNDASSKEIINLLNDNEVESDALILSEGTTLSKERIYVSNQQLYRLDNCKKTNVSFEVFKEKFDTYAKECNVIVIADYDYGVCDKENVKYIIKYAKEKNIEVIAISRASEWSRYKDSSYLVVNKDEFIDIKNFLKIDGEEFDVSGRKILDKLNIEGILVTLGDDGLIYIEKDMIVKNKLKSSYPVNVTGAGDTVLALFASNNNRKTNMNIFSIMLNMAGRVAVLNEKTLVVTKEDLVINCYDYYRKENLYNKILHKKYVKELVESWRVNNEKIVFTNGCFDILHPGHIKCLEEAKKHGDKLIVGINSDSSIKRLKGKDRPIKSENERVLTLASLEMIDCIIIFEEDTAINLIKEITPDIYVKGEEYRNKELLEAKFVKDVRYVEAINDLSTSNIIKRIVARN